MDLTKFDFSDGVTTDMVNLAVEYGKEKNAIKGAEEQIKARKDALSKQEEMLYLLLDNAGMSSFSAEGHTYYKRIDTYASIDMGNAEVALEWIREAGYGDSIKETVNPRTLTTIIKEYSEQFGGELPADTDGIKIRTVNRVGIRKK